MEITFSLYEAFMVGLFYYLAYAEICMPFIGQGLQDPATIGLLIGLVYGDPTTGLIVGASIGMLYISNMTVGGNLPSDAILAACISVPIAIKSGISTETAVAFAIPFSVLGTFVDNARRLINGHWNRRANHHVDTGEYNKIFFDAVIGPSLVSAAIRIIPLTLLLYFFGSAAGELVAQMPAWLNNAFTVIGGMLPGLGLALCVNFMGRRELLPYFLVGFYAVYLGGFNVVFVALIGVAIAFIHLTLTASQYEEDEDDEELEPVDKGKVWSPEGAFSKPSECDRWSFKYFFFFRISQCLEYFYGTGIGYIMLKPLQKIYKGNDAGLKAAMKRHLQPFITNPVWGFPLISGSLAMEEDIAKNGDPDGTKAEAIVSMKTGLMGPLAGLGDGLQGSIVMPLFKAFCYPLALTGNIIGAFPFSYWFAEMLVAAIIAGRIGYTYGKHGILRIINSPLLKKLLVGAGVLGIIMMGALSAGYVSLNLGIQWTTDMGTTNLNDVLNGLIPGCLVIGYMGISYSLLRRGVSFIKLVLGVCVFGILGSLIGIV
mgnify:CR=1 FL=1